jgi:CBS domain-containing protein
MRPDEPVSRIMTEAVVAIDIDRPVSEVLDCFLQYPIHHLPVVRHGKLVGMLSSTDVMKLDCVVPRTVVDRAAYLDQRLTIAQLMQPPVLSLEPSASVAQAAERMIDAGVHAAPVLGPADHVIGIVTTSDVMRSLLHGPPRRGELPVSPMNRAVAVEDAQEPVVYRRRPTDEEYAAALRTAQLLHVEERDPRHLGKALLYLDQRRALLEKVLELADRFLLMGQDEHTHALLLKAVHAAKRAEEHATGRARVPFALQ